MQLYNTVNNNCKFLIHIRIISSTACRFHDESTVSRFRSIVEVNLAIEAASCRSKLFVYGQLNSYLCASADSLASSSARVASIVSTGMRHGSAYN